MGGYKCKAASFIRGMRRGDAKTKSAKNDRAFKEERGRWEER